MADVWFRIMENSFSIPPVLEEADVRERWEDLAGTKEKFEKYEPQLVYHPRAPLEQRQRRAQLLTLGTVNSEAHVVAQSLVFRVLYLDDSMDWGLVADRLEQPAFGTLFPYAIPAGWIVFELYIRTTDLNIDRQRALVRILKACTRLKILTICNFNLPGTDHVLTSASPLLQDLEDMFLGMATSLRFLSLGLEMDSSAIEFLMRIVGKMKELRILFLYLLIRVTCLHYVKMDMETLPNIHTIAVDGSWGVHYPIPSLFTSWMLPSLRTFVTRGPDMLTGLPELLDSLSVPSLTDFSIELPYLLADVILPNHARITAAMFSWKSTILFGEYRNVRDVFLTGDVMDDAFHDVEGWEFAALHRTMDQIINEGVFPSLKRLRMVDFDVLDLGDLHWSDGVVETWYEWCAWFSVRNVEFVDGKGVPLFTVDVHDVEFDDSDSDDEPMAGVE